MHLRPLTTEAIQSIPFAQEVGEPNKLSNLLPLLPNMTTAAKSLEELGYCVIPDVISQEETEHLYQRVWHEFVEKAWPNCKMDDRSNWKETFPMHNPLGILLGPASHTQVMWDIRQDPRIVDTFAHIWNTQDLIVSMDGLSLMCPSEIREGNREPWPHVDQIVLRRHDNVAHSNSPPIGFVSESSLKTEPYTIQGQFLFEDSCDGDGGFYCIPQSHLKFSEFAPELEAIDFLDLSPKEKADVRQNYLKEFFNDSTYSMKHIIAPRGSLILWDSRTVHWNQHPSLNRSIPKHIQNLGICQGGSPNFLASASRRTASAEREIWGKADAGKNQILNVFGYNPRMRMVGLLCYVPKSRLTEDGLALRMKAFEMGIATGHNPANPQLKYNHIWPEFERYREDQNYIRPKINLTPLGQSLLGH